MRALLMMRKIPPARLLAVLPKDLRDLKDPKERPDPLALLDPREKREKPVL